MKECDNCGRKWSSKEFYYDPDKCPSCGRSYEQSDINDFF